MSKEPTVGDLLEVFGGTVIASHEKLKAEDEPVWHDPVGSAPTRENVLFLLGQLKRLMAVNHELARDRGDWRLWAEELFRMLPFRGRKS